MALGNPGSQYAQTRHNIGQMVLEHLSFYPELKWQKKFKGLYSFRDFPQGKVFFLTPLTYMNLSGESALAITQFFNISSPEILVLHDELDLPYGQVGFKKGGGLAGHNGLRSMSKCLGNQDFLRIRLGISKPTVGPTHAWVLSKFSGVEEDRLTDYLKSAAEALEVCLTQGFEVASASYSRKNLAFK